MPILRRIILSVLITVSLLTAAIPTAAQDEITFKEIATIGRGSIEQMEWSPDGTQIAVVTIRGVWIYQADDLTIEPRPIDVRDRRPKLFGRQYPVSYPENFFIPLVAFDSKWERLAVTEYGGGVNIFDMATGKKLTSVDDSPTVQALAFSSDGRTLMLGRVGSTGSQDDIANYTAEFLLVDVVSGKASRSFTVNYLWPNAMAFSPDDRYLVVSASAYSGDRGYTMYYVIDLQSDAVVFADFDNSTEGKTFPDLNVPPIVVVQNDFIGQYNAVGFVPSDAPFAATLLSSSGGEDAFAISPDLKKYSVYESGDSFTVKEVGSGNTLITYPLADSRRKLKGAFNRDSSRIAVSNETDKLTVWVLDNSTLLNNYGELQHLGCSSGDYYCVTSTNAHEVLVGTLGLPIHVYADDVPNPDKRFLSPDRRWSINLQGGSDYRRPDTTLSLNRLADGKEFRLKLRAFTSPNDETEYVGSSNVQDVYFDAASSMVAVAFSTPAKGGTYNDYVRVWKIDGEEPQADPIVVLEAPGAPKLLRRDPGTGLFFIGTEVGSVYVWDSVANRIIGALNLPDRVLGMEFSTSDGILITRSADGLIRLWKME